MTNSNSSTVHITAPNHLLEHQGMVYKSIFLPIEEPGISLGVPHKPGWLFSEGIWQQHSLQTDKIR